MAKERYFVVEVVQGFCKKPFWCDFVPKSMFGMLFVDITNLETKPDEFWKYNYDTKTFSPPDRDLNDLTHPDSILMGWIQVRQTRQIRLMESDWTQLCDAPVSKYEKKVWAKYRQELRDLPQKCHDIHPSLLNWPISPDRLLIDRSFSLKHWIIGFAGYIKDFIRLLISEAKNKWMSK